MGRAFRRRISFYRFIPVAIFIFILFSAPLFLATTTLALRMASTLLLMSAMKFMFSTTRTNKIAIYWLPKARRRLSIILSRLSIPPVINGPKMVNISRTLPVTNITTVLPPQTITLVFMVANSSLSAFMESTIFIPAQTMTSGYAPCQFYFSMIKITSLATLLVAPIQTAKRGLSSLSQTAQPECILLTTIIRALVFKEKSL